MMKIWLCNAGLVPLLTAFSFQSSNHLAYQLIKIFFYYDMNFILQIPLFEGKYFEALL